MWKRRKDEDEFMPETTPEVKPVAPVAAAPPRAPAPAPRAESTIGKSVIVRGDIYSKEDLHLDGKAQGSIDMPGNRLTVGANGKVEATIKAREVVVAGAVLGNVEAGDRITIRKDAQLEGDLKSASISIEDGAYFKGSIDIVRPAPVKAAPPQPKPSASVSPSPSTETKAAGATAVGKPPGLQQK